MISAHLNANDIRQFITRVEETRQTACNLQSVVGSVFGETNNKIQREATAYEKCIKDCTDAIKQAKEKIKIIEERIREIKQRISEIKQRLVEIGAECNRLSSEIRSLRSEISALKAESMLVGKVATAAAIAACYAQLAECSAELARLNAERAQLTVERARLQTELNELYDKKDRLTAACEGLTDERDKVQNSLERLRQLQSAMQEVRQNLTEIIEQLIKRAEVASPILQRADRAIQQYLETRLEDFHSIYGVLTANFIARDEIKKVGLSPSDRAEITSETNWSYSIVRYLRTREEAEWYIRCGLQEGVVNGRPALLQPKLDLDGKVLYHNEYITNRELMSNGKSPCGEDGERYELHHVGQHSDSPFAELLTSEHRLAGNYDTLHTSVNVKSVVDRDIYNKEERPQYWQGRSRTDITALIKSGGAHLKARINSGEQSNG